MKNYKVVLRHEPDVVDLVNIEDETDVIWAAPDLFKENDVISENDFTIKEANYVDDCTYGVGSFAFPIVTASI
jgi:hypothetical protein